MFRAPLCRLQARALSVNGSWLKRSSLGFTSRNYARALPKATPTFREQVARSRSDPSFSEKAGRPGIQGQVLFFLAGSCVIFSYGAFQTNLDTAEWIQKLTPTHLDSWIGGRLTNIDLKRAQNAEVIKGLREWYTSIVQQTYELPTLLRPWLGAAYVTLLQPYADASEGKRLCWKICLFNAAIWLAWKLKRLQRPMMVGFTHHPLSGLSYTLLTSMFSHRSFLHLACNILALESFGSAAYYHLMKEQDKVASTQLEASAAFHFLAFFISAGLFSSLASHVVSTKLVYPKLVAQLASPVNIAKKPDTWAAAVAATTKPVAATVAKTAPREILPSLGASGAIYASVTLTALAFPESEIALFIPPSYPINIQYGVGGLVLLDMLGVLRGWRFFDHYAHLGGAAFGVAYYAYGPTLWTKLRETLDATHTTAPPG